MKPMFFATPAEWRAWLEEHHANETELLVGFHKKGSGRPSITWPESVDSALCFGWIDGVRRRIDEDSYSIRFTPRRKRSIWSNVNIRRVAELTKLGLMHATGLKAFAAREDAKSGIYLYEQNEVPVFDSAIEQRFRANRGAWKFFEAQPPGYRKLAANYVMTAKREETRLARLKKLVEDSTANRRLGVLARPLKPDR